MADEQSTGEAGAGAAGALACRGIRGATTVAGADPVAIGEATAELLNSMRDANGFDLDDVAAAIFTLTDELEGANPAAAARAMGWSSVPLLMIREHGGDVRVAMCLRVLLLVNTTRRQPEMKHTYLRGAVELRPDLATLS